ncbi:MAG: F0F1 ATP synthase subunit B, partial [Bacteroidales bacterium]|nr:F0F1 ATP synthase subunit B [Bacteroidales bacterium]
IEREQIVRDARQMAEEIVEKAHAKAQAEADRIVEAARENINYEKLKAMHDLKNQIATLSIEIAEKLILSELKDKDAANALIDRELEKTEL